VQDLNDLYLYAAVVRHGGFAPAARALGAPKSKLSKRVARLEERLGVRLIERSTRKFRVTDTGQAFFQQVEAGLADLEAAEAVAAQAQAEPKGLVRVSCPPGLTQNMMAAVLPGFLTAHPQVTVQLLVIGRRVDVIEEPVDVALRVRERLDSDPNLTMRTLGASRLVLAASPGPNFLLITHAAASQSRRTAFLICLGVSTASHVREIAEYADGVIVGTALVAAIRDGGVDAVASLTKDLSTGLTKEEA